MKKVVLFFSVCAALGLASCGCNNSCENAAVADSTSADSAVVADSAVADSAVVADTAATDSVAKDSAKAE